MIRPTGRTRTCRHTRGMFHDTENRRPRPRQTMTRTTPDVRMTVLFSCLLLLLCSCNGNRSVEGGWTMSGCAGPNDEYCFLVCAHRLPDQSIQPSPILIWRQGTSPSVQMLWQGGRWKLVLSDTHSIEYQNPSVLLYEGPHRPLRELVSTGERQYTTSSAAIKHYIETVLPTRDEGDNSDEARSNPVQSRQCANTICLLGHEG